MNNYNFGDLLEKSRRQNAIDAAKTVSEYCKSFNAGCDKCVFCDKITRRCILAKHNRYGFPLIPEDWEVEID